MLPVSEPAKSLKLPCQKDNLKGKHLICTEILVMQICSKPQSGINRDRLKS